MTANRKGGFQKGISKMLSTAYHNSPESVSTASEHPSLDGQRAVSGQRPVTWSDLPLHPHDVEVLEVRGITPAIAAERGYYSATATQMAAIGYTGMHACDCLVIPNYSLIAEDDVELIRPHNPVVDKEGHTLKYLWPPGQRPAMGGAPARTRADADLIDRLIRDIDIPVIFVESILKVDAVRAALRDLGITAIVVTVHGTWGWLKDGATSSELRDIVWREKESGKVIRRRRAILLPDSDYRVKPEVQLAWDELGDALDRRKADVRLHIPQPAPDGSKRGPDDSLHHKELDLVDMIVNALPHRPYTPALRSPIADRDSYVAELEVKVARQDALISALAHVATSPDLNRTQAIPAIRALMEANYKKSKGEVDADGRAVVSSSEIANDYRTSDEPNADYNPNGGSRPLMQRRKVKAQMEALRDAGVIDMDTREVLRPRKGATPYKDTEFLVKVDDLPSALINLADYRKPERKKPTPSTPCPHCGEIHYTKTVRTEFHCCGSVSEKQVQVPQVAKIVDISTSPNLGEVSNDTNETLIGSVNYMSPKLGEVVTTRKTEEVEDEGQIGRYCTHRTAGEQCGEITEDYDSGHGSTRFCYRHAEQYRNRPKPQRGNVTSTWSGEVAS